jgi:hypothetical protein
MEGLLWKKPKKTKKGWAGGKLCERYIQKTQKSNTAKSMLDVCSVVDVDLGESELEVSDNLVACLNFDNGRKRKKVGNSKVCEGNVVANESIDTSVGCSVIDHEVRDGENSVEMGDLQKNIQGRELGVKGKGKIERRVASNTTIRGKHPRKKGTK